MSESKLTCGSAVLCRECDHHENYGPVAIGREAALKRMTEHYATEHAALTERTW